MLKKRSVWMFFLLFAFISACVPRTRYIELETDLHQTRQRLAQEARERETAERTLQEVEKRRESLARELSNLKVRYQDLDAINLNLSDQLQGLKDELDKKKSVMQLQEKVIGDLDETRKRIENSLKEQITAQRIKIKEMEGRLQVTFIDKILFHSGSVRINPKGKDLLLKFADSVRKDKTHDILVKGHTDNVPIGPVIISRYPTNWELSTSRATAVVRFLQEVGAVAPERLSACGHSFYRPEKPNDTEEGRRQNRRIEIILRPSP